MKHQRFCHNCGADISLDEPIRIDDFSMIGPAFDLCHKGTPVKLTNGQRVVVWALMKAYPDHVTKTALLERLDSDAYDNVIQVMICRIRAVLAELGLPEAIETVWGKHAYRWKPGGGDGVAQQIMDSGDQIAEVLRQLYDVPGSNDRPGG